MDRVTRLFYSRKSFMFPERQSGPHRGWTEEIGYLDAMFTGGAAYTVGKVNGDHWLLWFFDRSSDPVSLPTTPRIPFRPPLGISFMEPPPSRRSPQITPLRSSCPSSAESPDPTFSSTHPMGRQSLTLALESVRTHGTPTPEL
jgi:hypothetical protein